MNYDQTCLTCFVQFFSVSQFSSISTFVSDVQIRMLSWHWSWSLMWTGKPEPLVFHIPQAFFNALQQRLSLGSKKRRLPNYTTSEYNTCSHWSCANNLILIISLVKPCFNILSFVFLAFVRNDALPLGSFSKYTWHITNLMHVKRIFDTPEVCTHFLCFQILTNGHSICGQFLN